MTKRILIIEDNNVLASVYGTSLTQAGFQVAVANDGETGLDQVNRFAPDLVLLDLMLPKIDGLEVLRRIRSDADKARLPVIVFSNSYTNDRTREVWSAGATQVLVKASCSPKQLVQVVGSSLG
jgi:two-component system phosphate regulon response regulator PhoB